MNGVTQRFLTSGADPIPGDCLSAAVATVLELPLDAVPHFALFRGYGDLALTMWADVHGHVAIRSYTDQVPDERSVVIGTTRTNGYHAVVGEHGAITWDPTPGGDGLFHIEEVITFAPKIPRSEESA